MSRSGAAAYATIQVDYIAALSPAAILVGWEGREVWIPKSQIFPGDVPEGRSAEPAEINITEWFAKKEGMR